MPKNPFGIRNGKPIVISDLTEDERGLKCNSVCPQCNGKLEAKMGNIKVHHFAHTKDDCDETLAVTKGLFMLIEHMINNGRTFYAPPLVISYMANYLTEPVTINDFKDVIEIKSKVNSSNDYELIKGNSFDVKGIELRTNSKNRVEALVVTSSSDRQLAIRILPPPNICKVEKLLPFENFSTLICNASDINFYENKSYDIINILKNHDRWYWLNNHKIEDFSNKIVDDINESWRKFENARKTKFMNTLRVCILCGEIKKTSEFAVRFPGRQPKGKCKECLH